MSGWPEAPDCPCRLDDLIHQVTNKHRWAVVRCACVFVDTSEAWDIGIPDMTGGPSFIRVKSVSITNYSNGVSGATQYIYSETSRTPNSIDAVPGTVPATMSALAICMTSRFRFYIFLAGAANQKETVKVRLVYG